MTDENQPASLAPQPDGSPPRARNVMELPGMVAIGLYLVVLAAVVVLGVVGGHYPPLLLLFSALFLAAAGGLMFLLRWAWAMTLAAVVLLAFFNVWIFMSQHVGSALVQGLLNWVFFLYLIRTEVRTRLR
jgi:uncharacterized membrane protein YvlD (DUF360 family)